MYFGEWKGGRPHGHGRLQPVRGGAGGDGGARGEPVYVGQWAEGERSGQGVGVLPSGEVYDGEWGHGQPQGFGVAPQGESATLPP